MKMIGAVVGILVTLIVSILLFYNIAGSIDTTTVDSDVAIASTSPAGNRANVTYAANSTTDILDQAATFFTIAPIIAIVVVAVVILSYVSKIGGA